MRPAQNPYKALFKRPWVCSSCIQQRGARSGLTVEAKYEKMKREKRRFKYGEKLDKADDEWALRAEKIEAGRQDSMLSILEKRGYVHSIAG